MTFRHVVPDVAPGGPGAPAGTAVAAAPAETVDAEIPEAGPALRRCRLDGVIDYQRGSVTNSIAIPVVNTPPATVGALNPDITVRCRVNLG